MLKKIFFEYMSKNLSPFGFIFSKSKEGFIKKEANRQIWFTFLFYKYKGIDGIELNPVMQIRFDQIEEIFHSQSSFSDSEKKDTSTIGCSLENYLDNYEDGFFRKVISTENDAKNASIFYFEVFQNIVTPFFKKYQTLESIHTLINKKPSKDISLIHPIFRGSKGLIIAYLIKDNKIKKLLNTYTSFYNEYYDGFYKEDFEKIVKILEKQFAM